MAVITPPSLFHDLCVEDPEIATLIGLEYERQCSHIELIASENFVSRAVLQAQASILTNKYAEGYPGARYYGGCTWVDQIEERARARGCALFQCAYANVQPHSGSQANQAVFLALLHPGDTILSLDLKCGGHLTHGSSVNLSGRWFKIQHYGVDPVTHRIDMDCVREKALEFRPKLIIAGASAYPREIDFRAFRAIADECGALLLADVAHIAGLIVTGHHPHPFPHAHVVTTTTHKTLRGPRGGAIFTNDAALAKRINSAVFPGIQGGPLMHIIAGKAVAFSQASQPSFTTYIAQVIKNSQLLANTLKEKGFSMISGGTDTHLMLVDLSKSAAPYHELSGREAEAALDAIGMTCNKNAIPYDVRPVKETSGIRLGTPAMTTRGFKEDHMVLIANWIATCLAQPDILNSELKQEIQDLCRKFPVPHT